MADAVDRATRSRMMANIRGKDTKPEITIRSALHKRGLRYRLHVPNLPGKPDLVFPKFRAVMFINGCFWHGHDCKLFKLPVTRPEFWQQKINANQARDQRQLTELQMKGWRTLVVWECVTRRGSSIPYEALIDCIENWLTTSNDSAYINLGGIHVQLQNQ
jgi:DNA mismatch endonuclease (patch repair protein)